MAPAAQRGRRTAAIAGGVALAALLLAGYLQQPVPAPAPPDAQPASARTRAARTHAELPPSPFGTVAGAPAAAQDAVAPAAALLQPGLRDTLEALLLDAGEAATPQQLKQLLAPLVRQRFAPAQAAYALELVQRYVDYRVALGQLAAPGSLSDPEALQSALDARRSVRQRFFDGAEYDALFQQDDALDQVTLARLRAQQDASLSAAQRQQALAQAEAELPAAQRAARAAATQYLAAQAQTAAFEAQGTDAHTRYAARSAQYGAAAAQALAQLDSAERDWQARLDEYAQAQAAHSSQAALAGLRQQLFTPQEQLRIEGALALRGASGAAR